jgi:hypothetical protein
MSVTNNFKYTTMKELFLRECSISGEGMNEGWIDENNFMYFKYQKDVIKYIKEIIEEDNDVDGTNLSDDDVTDIGYDKYDIYWTEWED